jgi:hypothetical protein
MLDRIIENGNLDVGAALDTARHNLGGHIFLTAKTHPAERQRIVAEVTRQLVLHIRKETDSAAAADDATWD